MCRIRWPTRCTGAAPDFGPAVGDVLAAIAAEGRGALVLLGEAQRRRGRAGAHPRTAGRRRRTAQGALAEWRRNGAGAQILADLGLGKLRVLGTPRKQVGLAGFGLEVVSTSNWPRALNCAPAAAHATAHPHIHEAHSKATCAPPAGARFAIIASRWNPRITDALVDGARQAFAGQRRRRRRRSTWCACPAPGNCPWPPRSWRAAGKHAAIVALGCVVRGDTRHYEHVADRLRRRPDARVARLSACRCSTACSRSSDSRTPKHAPAAATATRAKKRRWPRSKWPTCWSKLP